MIIAKTKQVIIDPIYDSDYYNPDSQLIKIPDSSKDRCDQGIIVALGRDCDPTFEVGDHVIFSGYSGTTIGIDNRIYISIHSDFLKLKVTNEDYIIPGLYFKGKFDSAVLEDKLHGILQKYSTFETTTQETVNNILKQVALFTNRILISAPYSEVTKQLVLAQTEVIADRISVKPDSEKEQRDPIDERSH